MISIPASVALADQKGFEAQPRTRKSVDGTMVLFNAVV
jgi:hypothetical protein